MNGPTVGQRVRLTGEMEGEAGHDPLPVGATGVVEREANSVGQLWVRWDAPNEHRRLMLLTTDPFEVVAGEQSDEWLDEPVVGQVVRVRSVGPEGQWDTTSSGTYLGVLRDEEDGVPYHYFIRGEIGGVAQSSFGFPAEPGTAVTDERTPTQAINEALAVSEGAARGGGYVTASLDEKPEAYIVAVVEEGRIVEVLARYEVDAPNAASDAVWRRDDVRREDEFARRERTVLSLAVRHDCDENAVPYVSDGALGHGWECGVCGAFLQAG